MHNESNKLSQKCCEKLDQIVAVNEDIFKNFLALGWKINSDKENFVEALADKITIGDLYQDIREYIENGKPCIFIIIPDVDLVKIHKCVEINAENTTEDDWLISVLKDVQKLMSLYINQEDFENMT